MVDIFSNPQRPFFSTTQFIGLEAISEESYSRYIRYLFSRGGMTISDEALQYILTWTRRHTYYTQRLCHDVYERKSPEVNIDTVNSCCDLLLRMNEPYFLQYKQLLTAGQWNYLIALAKEQEVEQPYANDFLRRYNIGGTSVARRQLQTLVDKDLVFLEVTKQRAYYTVADLFLLRWLASEY